tara:strand:+ start:3072 stop:3590 length:519 start_codon:yes stop_codon:yes gene_type:complete
MYKEENAKSGLEEFKHKVSDNIIPRKASVMEDVLTPFVDLDIVLSLYLDAYRGQRLKNQSNICVLFNKHMNDPQRSGQEFISLSDVRELMKQIIPEKSFSPHVHYPRDITILRSFIYALVCGKNGNKVSVPEFLAGCNRFGVDNPCPIITKRISLYGNNVDSFEEDFKRLVE